MRKIFIAYIPYFAVTLAFLIYANETNLIGGSMIFLIAVLACSLFSSLLKPKWRTRARYYTLFGKLHVPSSWVFSYLGGCGFSIMMITTRPHDHESVRNGYVLFFSMIFFAIYQFCAKLYLNKLNKKDNKNILQ